METRNVDHREEYGEPSKSAGKFEQVKRLFENNSGFSFQTASMQLGVLRSTMNRILRDGSFLFPVHVSKYSGHQWSA